MKQMSLGENGFERKTKRTRKREFLDEMNLVVPWGAQCRFAWNLTLSTSAW